jgi:hypothetical protein
MLGVQDPISPFEVFAKMGKKGRYVRIQLLDKNYLSLAEVQVIGVDL